MKGEKRFPSGGTVAEEGEGRRGEKEWRMKNKKANIRNKHKKRLKGARMVQKEVKP